MVCDNESSRRYGGEDDDPEKRIETLVAPEKSETKLWSSGVSLGSSIRDMVHLQAQAVAEESETSDEDDE